MGRINPNDLDKYETSSNSSEWFKLPNDRDVATVQFMYSSPDELDVFACHKVNAGTYDDGNERTRYVDCKRDYDSPIDDCPFCSAGLPVKPVMIISMYDVNEHKVKIWERGKTFKKQLDGLFNRYPNLSDFVFDIERNGAKGDKKTTYQIFQRTDIEPEDLSDIEKPNFVGGFILDKTADEMQAYLDTGEFPENENSGNSRRQQSRRDTVSRRRG